MIWVNRLTGYSVMKVNAMISGLLVSNKLFPIYLKTVILDKNIVTKVIIFIESCWLDYWLIFK